MAKYIANAYLVHNGEIVQAGQPIELDAKQAEALGDKVSPSPEVSLKEKNMDELKEMARDRGIEGYNDMKKAELVAALAEEK